MARRQRFNPETGELEDLSLAGLRPESRSSAAQISPTSTQSVERQSNRILQAIVIAVAVVVIASIVNSLLKSATTPNDAIPQTVTSNATSIPANEKAIAQLSQVAPPPVDNAAMLGERFPETRNRLLRTDDIQSWSNAELRYAINEIYARHGADFIDQDIKKQFAKFSWYRPQRGKSYDAAEAEFIDTEKRNVDLLGTWRNMRRGGPPPGQVKIPQVPIPNSYNSAPSSSLHQQSAAQARIPNVSRYNGRGRIYKIPELKTLAGKRLNNAWLYGSFVYRRHAGSTLIAVTGARLLLVKEGSTEVRIDCAGGFLLRPQTVEFFRTSLGQPPSPTFEVLRSDPIQVLGVDRTSDGRLRVRARYHGAIQL